MTTSNESAARKLYGIFAAKEFKDANAHSQSIVTKKSWQHLGKKFLVEGNVAINGRAGILMGSPSYERTTSRSSMPHREYNDPFYVFQNIGQALPHMRKYFNGKPDGTTLLVCVTDCNHANALVIVKAGADYQ